MNVYFATQAEKHTMKQQKDRKERNKNQLWVMLFRHKTGLYNVFRRVLREMQFAPSAARKKPRAQSQSLVVDDVVQQN